MKLEYDRVYKITPIQIEGIEITSSPAPNTTAANFGLKTGYFVYKIGQIYTSVEMDLLGEAFEPGWKTMADVAIRTTVSNNVWGVMSDIDKDGKKTGKVTLGADFRHAKFRIEYVYRGPEKADPNKHGGEFDNAIIEFQKLPRYKKLLFGPRRDKILAGVQIGATAAAFGMLGHFFTNRDKYILPWESREEEELGAAASRTDLPPLRGAESP